MRNPYGTPPVREDEQPPELASELAPEGVGGELAVEGARVGGLYTESDIATAAARHGGELSRQVVGTGRIPRFIAGVRVGEIQDPNPVHVITFGDGKSLKVRRNQDGTLLVVGGTALTVPRPGPAGEVWVRQTDGSQVRMRNDPDNPGRKIPVLDENGDLITQQPVRRGSGTRETPALAALREAQTALAEGRLAQLGKPRPLAPETAFYQGAQAAHQEALTAQIYQKMVPKQLKVLQDLYQTVQAARDQFEAGNIEMDELNSYWDEAQRYAEAAFRGTTPAAEEKVRQEETTKRAQLAKDLLNRRVESGASLASNMMRDYRELLTHGPTGAGFDYSAADPLSNPLTLARLTAQEAGGGQQVSDLARALLQASLPEERQRPLVRWGGLPPAEFPGTADDAYSEVVSRMAEMGIVDPSIGEGEDGEGMDMAGDNNNDGEE